LEILNFYHCKLLWIFAWWCAEWERDLLGGILNSSLSSYKILIIFSPFFFSLLVLHQFCLRAKIMFFSSTKSPLPKKKTSLRKTLVPLFLSLVSKKSEKRRKEKNQKKEKHSVSTIQISPRHQILPTSVETNADSMKPPSSPSFVSNHRHHRTASIDRRPDLTSLLTSAISASFLVADTWQLSYISRRHHRRELPSPSLSSLEIQRHRWSSTTLDVPPPLPNHQGFKILILSWNRKQ